MMEKSDTASAAAPSDIRRVFLSESIKIGSSKTRFQLSVVQACGMSKKPNRDMNVPMRTKARRHADEQRDQRHEGERGISPVSKGNRSGAIAPGYRRVLPPCRELSLHGDERQQDQQHGGAQRG